MYRINEESGRLVGIWTDGQLTAEDLAHMTADLEERIARHGRLRLLFRADNFRGWEGGAFSCVMWFSRQHDVDVERVAMVGDKAWEVWVREFKACLTCAWARYFEPTELGEAWAWLRSDLNE